ncbi:hypothetical protein V8E53_000678 [Lactarius tabidus]
MPSASTPNFQPILGKAVEEYTRKTGKRLVADPLAEEIRDCHSPDAILALLQGKANELNQSQSSDERLTKWLTPTVNVLSALSANLGQGIGTVFPPIQAIFSGINILLVTAKERAVSRDVLIKLFAKIEKFFVETHSDRTLADMSGRIMVELLSVLAIATKGMKQSRIKTSFKKLVGRNDIEDALQILDKLKLEQLQGQLELERLILESSTQVMDPSMDRQ